MTKKKMGRPLGAKSIDYVPTPKNEIRRLVCTPCGRFVDMRVPPNNSEQWPLHKCEVTYKAEPFTKAIDVPKPPVHEFPPEPKIGTTYIASADRIIG
jgi:hypothetical protein